MIVAIMNSTSDTACEYADGRQAGRQACPLVNTIAGRQGQTDTNRHRHRQTHIHSRVRDMKELDKHQHTVQAKKADGPI